MRLLAALGFLTAIPIPLRRAFTPIEVGRGLAFFPLVGLLLGALLAAFDFALSRALPSLVASALVLAASIALIAALHLDSWMDCCDALFGHKTLDARLRILREPQIGAAGRMMLLLLKFAALASLTGSARELVLVLAPVLSRWGIAYAIIAYPYARGPEGKGSAFKRYARRADWVIATLSALAVTLIVAGGLGIALLLAAWLIAMGVARFAIQRIGGLTGDALRAAQSTRRLKRPSGLD